MKQIIPLAESLFQAIQALLDKPFAFFGHSLGALVAFELVRGLRRNGFHQPQILFVSACRAPHVADPHPPIHALPDREFLEALQQWNGIPSELLDQPEALQLLLPILRADFEAIENYVGPAEETPFRFPIVAYGGLDDPRLSREHLEGWALHTNSGFQSQYFPGDHFFIKTARESVIDSIAAQLMSSHEKG